MRILLVEDEKITRIALGNTLRKEGYEVTDCGNGSEALELINAHEFDVILTDLRLPGASGLEVLQVAKQKRETIPVILMTAFATVETAVEALKNGAYDYITKPFSPASLLVRLSHLKKMKDVEHENKDLKTRILSFENRMLVGEAPPTRKLVELVDMVADRETTVLIEGESGTGKELVARALHYLSRRKNAPFLAVNCAAIPENLFESEFFGHEKGSFSGAHRQHQGYFERAQNGTLFIDDIDDFPLQLQVKLLRVLQERQIERVGGTRTFHINARIVAATKVPLWNLVQEKQFREDLFYRLNIVPIKVPSLRDRIQDLPLLMEHFLKKYNAGSLARQKAASILPQLNDYEWPGNVRQFENMVQRIVALPELSSEDLIPRETYAESSGSDFSESVFVEEVKDYPDYKSFMEKKDLEILNWALEKSHWNHSQAAKMLDIPRSTLRSKLEKYGLTE